MYEGTKHNTSEARRRKKRETDRKAQRLSRKRTKSRIEQLENMVENLRQNDTNAQTAALMDQLNQFTKERDKLLQTLDSLGSSIRRHLSDSTTGEPVEDTTSESPNNASVREPVPIASEEGIFPITTVGMLSETSGSTIITSVGPHSAGSFTYNAWNCNVINKSNPMTMVLVDSIYQPNGSIHFW